MAFPVAGQPAQANAGRYTLSGVSEGDPVCKVRLGGEMAIGGWTIDLAKDCYGKFGLSPDIAAWTVYPDGSIAFIDPLRKPLIKFEPVEAGGYVGDGPKGRPIALDRETGGRALTEAERMSGTWMLTRLGGEVVCRYAMTSNKAGSAGGLKAKAGCPAAWARATGWRVAKGRISLTAVSGKKSQTLLTLPGDGIQGFDGEDAKGELYGFVRDW
jgi:hypothetical protein